MTIAHNFFFFWGGGQSPIQQARQCMKHFLFKIKFLAGASDRYDEDDLYQQPVDSDVLPYDTAEQPMSTTLPRAYGYTVNRRYDHLNNLCC